MRVERPTAQQLHRLEEYGVDCAAMCDAALFCYAPGETVLAEGMPMEHLLFVVSGKARVCTAAANGRDLLLSRYVSGGIIGDVELMTQTHRASTTIVATTAFACVALPYARHAPALRANAAFLNRIGLELANKLLNSTRNGALTALHSGEERLCTYLLENERDGVLGDPLTDVALSIGTSYRHTLRMLGALVDDRVLAKEGHRYRILDRKALIQRSSAPLGN